MHSSNIMIPKTIPAIVPPLIPSPLLLFSDDDGHWIGTHLPIKSTNFMYNCILLPIIAYILSLQNCNHSLV